MINKFRKKIDAGFLRLAGVDESTIKKAHFWEDHKKKYGVISGWLEPLIISHFEAFDNNNSTTYKSVEKILTTAQCFSEERAKKLIFNITVYLLLTYREMLRKYSILEKQENFKEFTLAEWKNLCNRHSFRMQKSNLNFLISKESEKIAFFNSLNRPINEVAINELYFQHDNIASFLVDYREDSFLKKHSQDNLYILWEWSFTDSADERRYYKNAEPGLTQLINKILERISKKPDPYSPEFKRNSHENPDTIILKCPDCTQSIRFNIPVTNINGLCKKCGGGFQVNKDSNGNYWLESKKEQGFQNINNASISEALSKLGLSANASKAEIKSAYRRLMIEYHPDKLMCLSPGLQSLATEEAKRINVAMDILRKAGMA